MSMTTQEIVNWVMHTPGNTNPRILGELIDSAVAPGPGPEPTETANCLYINNLDTITYHFFYASTWDECKEKLTEFTPGFNIEGGSEENPKIECVNSITSEKCSLQSADNSITSYEPMWTVINATRDSISNCKILKWSIG